VARFHLKTAGSDFTSDFSWLISVKFGNDPIVAWVPVLASVIRSIFSFRDAFHGKKKYTSLNPESDGSGLVELGG